MSAMGLAVEEAARRLSDVGPNELPAKSRVPVTARVLSQLRDPLVLVLLFALALTVATGDWTDATVIALVVVANTVVGVVQEVRADHAVTALARMSAPAVRVRRGGVEQSVRTADLVPGDVVVLGEGDVVPADGEVIESSSLLVDESALTGESVPVGHRARHDDEAGDDVSAGTVVVKGRAVVEVTRTGANSTLGRIAALTDVESGPTPLQRRMTQLSRVLALVVVALCAVVLVLGLARGEPTELMLVTAVSLAVAAVPESLPAVVALSLAMGAHRMATRHAIARRLPAVETLGSVTVLATDKTGTLTQAQMVVEEIWTPQREVTLAGAGGEPSDRLTRERGRFESASAPDVLQLLRAAALCNDAALAASDVQSRSWTGLGDPTEVALLVAAARVGIWRESLARDYPRVGELPFDSASQEMTTLHAAAAGAGRILVVRKGSPEALHARTGGRPQPDGWQRAMCWAAEMAGRGFRVLAVTAGEVDDAAAAADTELPLLGMVAMHDPAKPAAGPTVRACQDAGIVGVLVTGDHPATALAVARSVGLIPAGGRVDPGVLATGAQVAEGLVPDLTVPRVFARTGPEQKLAIVRAWQNRGAVVAMTGDGVNDGPALRRADIGVAMGHHGTEVARQAADLVLADDELATVVKAIEEGRRVYDNIRRFLLFGMAGGVAEILVMLTGPFTGLAVPLLAAQILWINLLTHGLTGVALGAEPVGAGAMRRPPRPPEQSVLGDGLWQSVLAVGVVISVVTLVLGLWSQDAGRPWRSLVFLALTCLQLGVALGLRPVLWTRDNLFLPVAVTCSFAAALAGLYVPALQDLLGLEPLPAGDVVVGVLAGLVGFATVRL
jgi:Ca2+-transporting ATPase